MKSRKYTISLKKIGILGFSSLALIFLTSWSPPTGEDIELGIDQKMLIPRSVIEMNPSFSSSNTNSFRDQPALIIGYRNNLLVGTSGDLVARGIVAGNDNTLISGPRPSTILGQNNYLRGARSLVTGMDNLVAGPGSSYGNYSDLTSETAVLGKANQVYSGRAFAVGFDNFVTGYDGIAIGSGLDVTNGSSTALGQYNDTMKSEDVLVVGTGTGIPSDPDNIERMTALRITDDGSVILGRAQGDISMGAYE